MSDIELASDVFAGTTDGGEAVYLDIGLYVRERDAVTVNHETIKAPYYALTISALVRPRKGGRVESAGQCVEYVGRITSGPIGQHRDRLVEVWQEWHLNDMSAACAHQTVPDGLTGSQALDTVPPCPESGYRYGSAWLVRPLPAEIEAYAREVAALLVSQDDGHARKG